MRKSGSAERLALLFRMVTSTKTNLPTLEMVGALVKEISRNFCAQPLRLDVVPLRSIMALLRISLEHTSAAAAHDLTRSTADAERGCQTSLPVTSG